MLHNAVHVHVGISGITRYIGPYRIVSINRVRGRPGIEGEEGAAHVLFFSG